MRVSIRTAYFRNIFTAGDASVWEWSAAPSVMLAGGSMGIMATSQMRFSVMVRVVIQHFSKNTVISMVLGHPNSEITCIPPS